MAKRRPEGISVRHARACPTPRRRPVPLLARATRPRSGARATASGSRGPSRPWPPPRRWRHDATSALRRGTLRAGAAPRCRQAAEEWLEAAQAGLVRNRSGDPYKPSALRGYEQALRDRILPALGDTQLNEIRRSDVQRLVNRLMADGLERQHDPQRADAAARDLPARAGARRGRGQPDDAASSCRPCAGGASGSPRPPRRRADRRAAGARSRRYGRPRMYAGLRSGELQALTDELVDLDANVIRVRVELGSEGRPRRTEEPRGPAHGADRRACCAQHLRRAAARARPARRPLLRPRRREAVLESGRQPAGRTDLAGRGPRADRPARLPAHIRLADDRRRRERQGALGLHGPRVDHDDARPLRAPVPGLRGRGGRPARRLSRARDARGN